MLGVGLTFFTRADGNFIEWRGRYQEAVLAFAVPVTVPDYDPY